MHNLTISVANHCL